MLSEIEIRHSRPTESRYPEVPLQEYSGNAG
jgi:hypothetical protein